LRRYWDRAALPEGIAVAPWSAEDQERVEQVCASDPVELADWTGLLDGIGADTKDIVEELHTLDASHLGGVAGLSRCAELCSAIEDRADELCQLTAGLRAMATRLEAVLAELTHRMSRSADPVPHPASSPEPPLDESLWAYGTVLRQLRAGLDAADQACSRTAVDSTWPAAADSTWGSAAGEADQPWAGVPPGPVSVPGTAASDSWAEWRPLSRPPAEGPLLAGTEGTRPETDTGVRIAQLPDA
jgi:hypothetical protein